MHTQRKWVVILCWLTVVFEGFDLVALGASIPTLLDTKHAGIDPAGATFVDTISLVGVGILGDVGAAMTIADRVHSGKVHINEQTVLDEANAPFGGVGASGTGSRFGGATANIEAFTEVQWLTMRPEIAQYPF